MSIYDLNGIRHKYQLGQVVSSIYNRILSTNKLAVYCLACPVAEGDCFCAVLPEPALLHYWAFTHTALLATPANSFVLSINIIRKRKCFHKN